LVYERKTNDIETYTQQCVKANREYAVRLTWTLCRK